MSVPRTNRTLAVFLRGLTPGSRETARWQDGLIRLRVSSYLSDLVPPRDYITSARCLIIRGNKILVQRDQSGAHVLPGGRLDPDETPEEAMRREVLEETGWNVGLAALLGFMRFHHLTPRPTEYTFPYPDFIQVVYVADAVEQHDAAKLDDGWEIGSRFQDTTAISKLKLPAGQRLLLNAALEQRVLLVPPA